MSVGVDIDGAILHDVETAGVIETKGVIDVVVGVDNCITAVQLVAQSLLAEIGGSIDENNPGISLWVDEAQA